MTQVKFGIEVVSSYSLSRGGKGELLHYLNSISSSLFCMSSFLKHMNKPTFKEKQKTLFERQKKLRDNPTPAEVIFMQRLLDYNIDFIFQKCFIAKDYYCIVDFYLPKPFKVVFEIDGDYHDSTEQKKKDYARDIYLRDVRGFSVIRIKNEDVNVFPLESFLFNP